MSKPVLGLDVDDVLADFNATLFGFHNMHYGTSLTRDDIIDYRLEVSWGCSKEEACQRIRHFHRSPEYKNLPPISGAVASVNELSNQYDIHLITARPDEIREETCAWIQQHFPYLVERVHFTRQVVGGDQRPKSEVCQELGVSIFVDDALHHTEDLSPAVEKVFLFDTPWNQTSKALPENVLRVYSWEEITKKLLPL
ncbi:MAG: hypothetical protein WDZ82_03070 [Candidatus Paceibacterota bacterium]